jgi:hypothetical protein
MPGVTDALDRLIDRFIAGELPFMQFWRQFMDLYHDAGLTQAELKRYEPAYDVVYMGSDSAVRPEDASVGVRSADQVRATLKRFRG